MNLIMKKISINNFDKIIDEVNESSNFIIIKNKNNKNVILINEKKWKTIQETLFLNSIPNMANSIIEW